MKNDVSFKFKFEHTCTANCGVSEACPLQPAVFQAEQCESQDYFDAPPIENQMCVPYPDPEGY